MKFIDIPRFKLYRWYYQIWSTLTLPFEITDKDEISALWWDKTFWTWNQFEKDTLFMPTNKRPDQKQARLLIMTIWKIEL